MVSEALKRDINRVVREGNCSGCGACTHLDAGVAMRLSPNGFFEPSFDEGHDGSSAQSEAAVARFRAVCPGVAVQARPRQGLWFDPILGPYLAVYQGYAADPEVRHRGSSGGAISAITRYLLDSGETGAAVTVRQDPKDPRRSASYVVGSAEEALESAGSRYAPVSTLPMATFDPSSAIVGKPCEVYAARQLSRTEPGADEPVLLSFFCAGTPSQHATDQLVSTLMEPEAIASLQYRGNGWPGRFTVSSSGGESASVSYDESWGKHLGRAVHSRCKVCPDGTGESADIAVGDFWRSDERGFPVFEESQGNSVIIARTLRGSMILEGARKAGYLVLNNVDLAEVVRMQPLQATRRRALLGRLIGRRLAGGRSPKYSGFRLSRSLILHPFLAIRHGWGAYLRTKGV